MSPDPAKKVLVIDDDADLVQITAAFLKARGYRCVMARSGAQGLREFSSGDVDLVVTDLNMPAGDGVALVEAIRETSAVPVIIVSGCREEFADRVRFLPHVNVVEKPFESQALLQLIGMELSAGIPV
jgi:DNA-binding response OmpR family regulator